MSDDGWKIVWLRVNDGHRVQAFYADYPKERDNGTLEIKGPFPINGGGWVANNAGQPLFDYRTDEIVWAFPTVHMVNPEDGIVKVWVWRIGQHFEYQSQVETCLTCDSEGQPSILLKDDLLSVCSRMVDPDNTDEREMYKWQPMIAIPGLDSQDPKRWMNATIQKQNAFLQGGQTTLLSGPKSEPGMKYVYLLRTSGDLLGFPQLFLASIKSANYKETPKDSSLMWIEVILDVGSAFVREVESEAEPEPGYPPEMVVESQKVVRDVAHVITHDKRPDGAGKHYLHLFKSIDKHLYIQVMTVPLRKDGSIDSYEGTMKPDMSLKIPFSAENSRLSTDLKAYIEGDLIIFTWLDKVKNLCACTATVNPDGTLEVSTEDPAWVISWDIDINWENKPSDKEKSWTMVGVTVPADFT